MHGKKLSFQAFTIDSAKALVATAFSAYSNMKAISLLAFFIRTMADKKCLVAHFSYISNKLGALILLIKWFTFWAHVALLRLCHILLITDTKSHSKALYFQFPEMGSLPSGEFFRLLFNLVSSTLVFFSSCLAFSSCYMLSNGYYI